MKHYDSGEENGIKWFVDLDSIKKEWIQTGNCEKVLFIITEQSFKQIKKMVFFQRYGYNC